MSGTIINPGSLARYAQNPDIEIRVRSQGQDGPNVVAEQTGSLGGRLVRNLAIAFSSPSTAEKSEIMAAKRQTLAELKAIYGDDIGEKAFRAHVGKSDGNGAWISSAAHPITGRHVTAMVETAQEAWDERHPPHSEIPMLRKMSGGEGRDYGLTVAGTRTKTNEVAQEFKEAFLEGADRSNYKGPLPQAFWSDVNRQAMVVHPPGRDARLLSEVAHPEGYLSSLTNSDQGAAHLSLYMTQLFMTIMSNTTYQTAGMFAQSAPDYDEDHPRPSVQQVDAGRITDKGRDFVQLTYRREAQLQTLTAMSSGEQIPVDPEHSRLAQSMTLRVAVDDLEDIGTAYNFEIIDPPKMIVRARLEE